MWASNLPHPWRKSRTPKDFIEEFEEASRPATVVPPDEMFVKPGDLVDARGRPLKGLRRQYAGDAREQRLQWEADLDREAQKKDMN